MKARRLAHALEYVGYWRTTPASIDPTNTSTMNPAATGIGAAVMARVTRSSPQRRSAKCRKVAQIAARANSAKKIVLTVIGPIFGIALLNGTP